MIFNYFNPPGSWFPATFTKSYSPPEQYIACLQIFPWHCVSVSGFVLSLHFAVPALHGCPRHPYLYSPSPAAFFVVVFFFFVCFTLPCTAWAMCWAGVVAPPPILCRRSAVELLTDWHCSEGWPARRVANGIFSPFSWAWEETHQNKTFPTWAAGFALKLFRIGLSICANPQKFLFLLCSSGGFENRVTRECKIKKMSKILILGVWPLGLLRKMVRKWALRVFIYMYVLLLYKQLLLYKIK